MIESLKQVFDAFRNATPKHVKELHTNDDVDSSKQAHHHTIGLGAHQAASGADLKALQEVAEYLDTIVNVLVSERLPVGNVIMLYDSVAPYGYLLCDGSPFSGVTYPALAAKLGGTNTPDFRDRVPVGVSGSKALGATNGADTVSLVKANIPTHVHDMTHTHTYAVRQSAAAFGGAGAAATPTVSGSLNTLNTNAASSSTTGNGAADGLGDPVTAVDIQNKKLALNFYIKAL